MHLLWRMYKDKLRRARMINVGSDFLKVNTYALCSCWAEYEADHWASQLYTNTHNQLAEYEKLSSSTAYE